jgi:hypothetical protein
MQSLPIDIHHYLIPFLDQTDLFVLSYVNKYFHHLIDKTKINYKQLGSLGYLNIYQWHDKDDIEFAEYAIKGGQLHVLKWLHQTKKFNFYHLATECFEDIIRNNHFDTLKWLIRHHKNIGFFESTILMHYAAMSNNLLILKWLVLNDNFTMTNRLSFNQLIENGSFDAVDFLMKISGQQISIICFKRIKVDNHKIMTWIHDNKYEDIVHICGKEKNDLKTYKCEYCY